MQLASNIARRDTANRKGKNSFLGYTFNEYAELCDKLITQYCTWYAYEQDSLYEFTAQNDWSISGYHYQKKPSLYFDFIPFDFDSEESIDISFVWARKFVDWVLAQGIGEDQFSIWLSGSKGFHVEIDWACFETQSPSADILRRLKQFAERIQTQLDIELDESLYSAARLYRIPNTCHAKTGLFKTRIPLESFTREYLETRAEWAGKPGNSLSHFPHTPIANPIPLPLVENEQREIINSEEIELDESARILPKCPKLRGLLTNPEGREFRRQAVGVLTEAYGSTQAPELLDMYTAWRAHPYMDEKRIKDAEHWLEGFEKDGIIKCQKSCTSLGCGKDQKALCKTQYPMDHLVMGKAIEPISIEDGRIVLRQFLSEAVYNPDQNVYVADMPIGLGKSETIQRILADDPALSCFYLCPTHDLAREIKANLDSKGVANRHLKSRQRLETDSDFRCNFREEIAIANFSGHNVARSICTKCPRFPANVREESSEIPCEYYAQFQGIKDIPVVIGVHSHANPYVFEQIGMVNRSFLLIDESAIFAFSTEVPALDLDAQATLKAFAPQILDAMSKELEANYTFEPEESDIRPGLFGFVRAQHMAEQAALILDSHGRVARNVDEQRQIARFVYACVKALIGGLPLSPDDVTILRDFNYQPQYVAFLNRVIEKSKFPAAMELREGYRHLAFPDILGNAIRVTGRLGLEYKLGESYYYPTEMPEGKVIILDATSSKPLYERLVEVTKPMGIERRLIYNKLPFIEQTQVHITQITNSGYSKTRISSGEDVLEKLTFVIKSLRSTFPDQEMLCVSVLDLEEEIKEAVDDSGKTTFAHFGSMQGQNKYGNHPFQVILGGFFVPNVAIVQGLKRLGINSVTEDLLEATTITVRNKHTALNGDSYFSQRKAYRADKGTPLALANCILEQKAVSEVVQSVRQRLFSGDGDKRCYILTNIGLKTIYANRFVTLDELTLELEDMGNIKSELDTSQMRRTNLWSARIHKLAPGAEFKSEDIGEYDRDLRRFLELCETNGVIRRVGAKRYEKVRALEDADTQGPKVKPSRASVMAALNKWFQDLKPKAEFTSVEALKETNTSSIQFLKDWIAQRIENNELVKIGNTKGVKYRKQVKMLASLDGIV